MNDPRMERAGTGASASGPAIRGGMGDGTGAGSGVSAGAHHEELVRQDMKLMSPEGLPPTRSSSRPFAVLFVVIAVVGAAGVIAAGAYFGRLPGALVVSFLLLAFALVGGLPRLLADTSRAVEHHEAEKEINAGAVPRRF
ncbi:MAG TPA: hypothetical protein VD963_05165 [Phycisphaerales bacterium]|nr:hypothetical protein [Phycisphaerales bacterium]